MSIKPNVLYLHSHDTGRYVQPYGHAMSTPNLQALAEQGMLFTQAHNAAPTCSPSRAALLTGQMPHSCGQWGLVNRGFELRDRNKHLANYMSGQGYRTALAGVHHVVRDPLTCGYQEHLTPAHREDHAKAQAGDPREAHGAADRATAQAAAQWLRQPREGPFFLSVGFFNTHRRFPDVQAGVDDRYVAPPPPLPNTPRTRYDMACFGASARILDDCVGQVLDALDQAGLAENTLVVCTTDHGIAFPWMKCNLTQHGTGVMLILRGPGGFAGGKVCDALVSHLDLYPTICELAGIEPPNWLQGASLLPLARGEVEEIHEAVYAEVNFHCPYEPLRNARTLRWNYVRRYADYPYPMLPNIDESPSKDLLVEHGLAQRVLPREELYDLVYDPNEVCNLAERPEYAVVLEEMRGRLHDWMIVTYDALLHGPIPVPDSALLSLPTERTPADLWGRLEQPKGYG